MTHSTRVAYVDKDSVNAVFNNFGHPTTSSAHHGQTRCHCFKYGIRDSFAQTRKKERVRPTKQLFNLWLSQTPQQMHRTFAAEFMDHEQQLLSLRSFTCYPVINLNTCFAKFSHCSDAVIKAFFPMKPPNREQSKWSFMLGLSATERRKLIHRNCGAVHQDLAGRGTEALNDDSHIIRHAADEVGNFKDTLQSNATLWIFERLNLLGGTAATHSNLRVSMEPRKFIKVRGSNARELKVSNL